MMDEELNQQEVLSVNKDAKRWKNFLQFFKRHRYIAPTGIIGTNENGRIIPLKFIIHTIKGLAMDGPSPDPEVHPYCFINATFFSKKKSKFFGRTYKSEPIRLKESTKGSRSYETEMNHNIYCHTQITDNPDSVLVLELEIKGIHKVIHRDKRSKQDSA